MNTCVFVLHLNTFSFFQQTDSRIGRITLIQSIFVNPETKISLSGEPDYFGRNEISSGGDLSHYSSASLY